MAWYNESVFYHIYPLGLLDAPKENDYGPCVHRLHYLMGWIEHIKTIGCNAIYIGPLFESVGHGYETTDYRKLDSRLGDNEDLKAFVSACHDKGIRVIFDGVFNHTGRDFFAFQELKQHRENARYRDWYCNVNFWGNNEYNDGFSYENWGGYNLLVKLNQRNPEVRDYLCDVVRYWVSEFDVDGIRLDAANVLDFDFMQALRRTANEVKPDFWLMGEVIHGDYGRWVNDHTLHSVTNYALHKAFYSAHNDQNYFELAHTVRRTADLVRQHSHELYNFVDNHDVERIATKINNKANLIPVNILLYTLPGIPSVYYGSELGIEGRKERGSDASLRPALNLDWVKEKREEALTQVISRLGHLRLRSKALAYGDYRELLLETKRYAYARTLEDEVVVVSVNNDREPTHIQLHQLPSGHYTGLLYGGTVDVQNGELGFELSENSGEVWVKSAALEKEVFTPIVSVVKEQKHDTYHEPIEETKPEQQITDDTPVPVEPEKKTIKSGACTKYGLDERYSAIDPDQIRNRSDYEQMSIEELQVAILEKMAKNGPVNDQMIRTVMENVYPNSLLNWVRSFR